MEPESGPKRPAPRRVGAFPCGTSRSFLPRALHLQGSHPNPRSSPIGLSPTPLPVASSLFPVSAAGNDAQCSNASLTIPLTEKLCGDYRPCCVILHVHASHGHTTGDSLDSVMSIAGDGGRGGLAALHTSSFQRQSLASPASHSPAQQDLSATSRSRQKTTAQGNTADPSTQSSHAQRFSPPKPNPNSVTLDLPNPDDAARGELLRDAVFPAWTDDAVGEESFESPEELQKKDPLGTQIWKLYSRTKTRLPNQERMENLTWRMMAMNLRRREQMQAAYATSLSTPKSVLTFDHSAQKSNNTTGTTTSKAFLPPPPPPPPASTPSGIAQLRRSVETSPAAQPSDPMNLDDFIVPTSMASPAGILTPSSTDNTPSVTLNQHQPAPLHSKTKNTVHIPNGAPASSLPRSSIPPNRYSEFDYVQKRVRKTSIDERRSVCCCQAILQGQI